MAAAGLKAGLAPGAILAGFCCFGLILFAVAAIVVLSIIAVYTRTHSVQSYGEQYTLAFTLLKVLYSNSSGFYFRNGSIVDSAAFSTLCTAAYKSITSTAADQFYACLMSGGLAFTTNNTATSNTKRRKRQSGSTGTTAGLYEFYKMTIYFSSTCLGNAGLYNYISSSSNDLCRKRRLTACNSFANAANSSTGVAWNPVSSLTQSIYSSNQTYQTITVQAVYPYPLATAYSIANTYQYFGNPALNYALYGCQYMGTLSQTAIAYAINSQYSATSTTPATVLPG